MKLTIGMAAYKNPTEVWFTIQALRMYHDLTDVEILVVDNSRDIGIKSFCCNWASGIVRYIPFTDTVGTAAAKNQIFKEAKGEWVFSIDSHIMLAPNAISSFKTWADNNQDCYDLLHGPMLYDDLITMADSLDPVWGSGLWGQWSNKQKLPSEEPYEIQMHGMGLFGCKKDAWLGFNPEFKGFGGEEGYIHEKYRKNNRRVLCLPFMKWLHHFRPIGTIPPYTINNMDKFKNYEIGFDELGLDKTEMIAHFKHQR